MAKSNESFVAGGEKDPVHLVSDDASLILEQKGGLPPASQFQHLSRRLLSFGVETRGYVVLCLGDVMPLTMNLQHPAGGA